MFTGQASDLGGKFTAAQEDVAGADAGDQTGRTIGG